MEPPPLPAVAGAVELDEVRVADVGDPVAGETSGAQEHGTCAHGEEGILAHRALLAVDRGRDCGAQTEEGASQFLVRACSKRQA
jgi:hypothetical protein